jgi:hypothetical protein
MDRGTTLSGRLPQRPTTSVDCARARTGWEPIPAALSPGYFAPNPPTTSRFLRSNHWDILKPFDVVHPRAYKTKRRASPRLSQSKWTAVAIRACLCVRIVASVALQIHHRRWTCSRRGLSLQPGSPPISATWHAPLKLCGPSFQSRSTRIKPPAQYRPC